MCTRFAVDLPHVYNVACSVSIAAIIKIRLHWNYTLSRMFCSNWSLLVHIQLPNIFRKKTRLSHCRLDWSPCNNIEQRCTVPLKGNLTPRETWLSFREKRFLSRETRVEKIMSFPHELCLARYQLLNQKVSFGFIATQGRRRLSLVDAVSSISPSSERMRGLWVEQGLKGIKEETDLRGNAWIIWLAVLKSSQAENLVKGEGATRKKTVDS